MQSSRPKGVILRARVGHPCDLSAEDKENQKQRQQLAQEQNLPLADTCDFCKETKAIKKLEMQDGTKVRLCQQCYDEEMKARAK
jgi:superfamily II helicase